ncbi:MAG TPA: hypothetical protein VFD45_00905 [Patescibacteria group bacterium]|nr:hypothetical protein [Patescibacteria group bacterium]
MNIDEAKLLTIIIEAGTFISAFAAIIAGIIMFQVKKHFGTGILAAGFKSISIGVFFIAGGILLDSVQTYMNVSGYGSVSSLLLILKGALFVIGTYIIVIGSKKTGDNLESLTK